MCRYMQPPVTTNHQVHACGYFSSIIIPGGCFCTHLPTSHWFTNNLCADLKVFDAERRERGEICQISKASTHLSEYRTSKLSIYETEITPTLHSLQQHPPSSALFSIILAEKDTNCTLCSAFCVGCGKLIRSCEAGWTSSGLNWTWLWSHTCTLLWRQMYMSQAFNFSIMSNMVILLCSDIVCWPHSMHSHSIHSQHNHMQAQEYHFNGLPFRELPPQAIELKILIHCHHIMIRRS